MNPYAGSYLTIPATSQPPASITRSGLSISAWIQASLGDAADGGFLLAKTSLDGQRHYYALKITSDFSSTTVEFRYSVPDNMVARTGSAIAITQATGKSVRTCNLLRPYC